MFEDRDAAAALTSFDGAQQARRAAAENECIEGMSHGSTDTSGAKARIKLRALYAALKRRSSTLLRNFVTCSRMQFSNYM